jgi:hypothetical protein
MSFEDDRYIWFCPKCGLFSVEELINKYFALRHTCGTRAQPFYLEHGWKPK